MSLELHSSLHDSEGEFPGVVQCALCKTALDVSEFFKLCDTLIGNFYKGLRDVLPELFFRKYSVLAKFMQYAGLC